MKNHFFIVYDFASDRKRAKFVRILEKFGVRVQYSIFEFFLTEARKIELISSLKKEKFFDIKKNSAIMIIPVHQNASEKIERFGETVDILTQPCVFSI